MMDDKPALNELPALLAEELARIDGLNPVTRDIIRGILDDAVDRAEEAEARVAKLEAQLAAQQWRPVTEKPPAPDWYQVGDIGVGVYDLWYSGEAWHRSSFQGATYRTPPMSAPDYWRPIPPLPPAPQEPPQ